MIMIVNGRQTDGCQIVKVVRFADKHLSTAVTIHAKTLPDWVKDAKPGDYMEFADDKFGRSGGTLTKVEYDWTPEMVGRTAGLLPVFKEAPLRITLTMESVPATRIAPEAFGQDAPPGTFIDWRTIGPDATQVQSVKWQMPGPDEVKTFRYYLYFDSVEEVDHNLIAEAKRNLLEEALADCWHNGDYSMRRHVVIPREYWSHAGFVALVLRVDVMEVKK